MVETVEQLQYATTRTHFKDSKFACIGNKYYRICAPEDSDSNMHACILWTKSCAEDAKPSWDKVVSDFNIVIRV